MLPSPQHAFGLVMEQGEAAWLVVHLARCCLTGHVRDLGVQLAGACTPDAGERTTETIERTRVSAIHNLKWAAQTCILASDETAL